MKLTSNLWISRHGIYYFRYKSDGKDTKKTLKTRSPLIAKQFAYKLSFAMAYSKDLLEQLLSNPGSIKTWTLETHNPNLKISTDGSIQDHERALEVVEKILKNQPNNSLSIFNNPNSISYTLKDSIEAYRKERDPSIKPRSIQTWNTDFKQILNGLGELQPVHLITVSMYTEWRIKVIDLLAPSSQDSKNNTYKNFFDWCLGRGMCHLNPVVKCKLGKNRRHELQAQLGKKRAPYSSQDYQLIFDPKVRTLSQNPCMFWLPLIAATSGGRLEEIVNIELSSIQQDQNNIWTFSFGKTKTIASIRTIPIHPNLINSGFLDYVNDVKKSWPNATNLFPYMNPVKGRLSHKFSKDYGSFKKKLGIPDNKDFHSFRTTVAGLLKLAGINSEMSREYIGHQAQEILDVHEKDYSSKTPFQSNQVATSISPVLDLINHGVILNLYKKGAFVPFLTKSFYKIKRRQEKNKNPTLLES